MDSQWTYRRLCCHCNRLHVDQSKKYPRAGKSCAANETGAFCSQALYPAVRTFGRYYCGTRSAKLNGAIVLNVTLIPALRVLWVGALPLSMLLSPDAAAHFIDTGGDTSSADLWQSDPVALLILILTAFWYLRGSRMLRQRNLSNRSKFNRQQWYFWLGWSILLVALASPIDPLGELLFSAHMVQHELIMIVASPLLVLSRPTSAILIGMGKKIARPIAGGARNAGLSQFRNVLLGPASAWTLHALILWGWHIPALFNASLNNSWIHTAQHISFLLAALVFWYSLMHIQKSRSVVGMLYLFSTALHASLLGALLTFSPEAWYQPYLETAPSFGLTALQDQQIGGLIMWMPAGIVFIGGALMLLARLLPATEPGNYQSGTYRD